MSIAPASLIAELDDRYQLLEVIGQGGMAVVYRAQDVKHDRTVALKVLHDDLAASLGPERFKREIRIAARLQHPHILSVFDSGESAGRLWFTMPYVQGESLRDRLRRTGTLPVEMALVIVREAAQALAYAHKQGVIHRDIKPENILITEDGATLVADFGIARAIGDRTFETGLSQSLTQTGSAIGTPTYMAPEQATGETVLDERVDQYALAAVLYEMLTGAPPFTGANAAALIAARFTTQVTPMRTVRTEVPTDVDSAVLRALALKPFDRFPTIADFARAVAPAMATPQQFDTHSRHAVRAPLKRRWFAVVGVVALVAVAGAALWRRGATTGAPTGPVRIAVLPLQNLGDSADAYFADGMSDELRAKLVSVPGMQVIARASSVQYAGTDKTPAQIAEELGVRYLLTGTLRYQHRADGSSTVQVRPELMEVGGSGPATTRWQAAFDEPLTNAIALQTTIAEQVAAQLQVTLGVAARTRLAATPTTNPLAYDAYLRGTSNRDDSSPMALRGRIAELERAVTLDPSFAMAWAELARERANLWSLNSTPELAAQAQQAAERARAVAPGEMAGHLAWTFYHRTVTGDMPSAEKEIRAALQLEPDNPAMLARLARTLDDQGRAEEARPLYARAAILDPRSIPVWANLTQSLLQHRRYVEARQPMQRYMALAPTSQDALHSSVMLNVALGDLDGARTLLREGYRRMAPEALDVHMATFNEYGWILDDAARQRVLDAPLAAFDGDVAQQEIVRAQIYRARGDLVRSRQAAARAVPAFITTIAKAPDDAQMPLLQGFAAALAGQPAEATRLMQAAQATERRAPANLRFASYFHEVRARIHTLNGNYDQAFDEIEQALAKPGNLGRGQLSLDPMWAPLRALPRYKQIMTTVSEQERR